MEQQNEALNKEELQGQLIIKAIGDESDTHYFFEGYGNVFNVLDSAGHITVKGAFAQAIQDVKTSGIPLPILWNHNFDVQIGSWVEMYEDDYGLYMKGRLTKGVPQAETVYKLMKGGDLSGLSINGTLARNNTDSKVIDGILYIYKINRLLETSVTPVPANFQSRVTLVKSMLNNNELPTISQVEKALREIGFSRSQAKVLLSLGYKGLLPESQEEIEDDVVEEVQSVQEETETSAMLETETANENPETQETTESENINTVIEADTPAETEEVQKSLNELASILKSLKI